MTRQFLCIVQSFLKKSDKSTPPYRPVLMTSSVWSVCSLFAFLTNENLSCFCVFLFFSVFFFSSMCLWGDGGC